MNCPNCESDTAYFDGALMNCPMCAHEWGADEVDDTARVVKDAVGNVLQSGDSVSIVKDLKIRGGAIKVGTKVKSIRLLDEPKDGHDIDAKIDGVGGVLLKSSVVKKL